MQLHKTHRARAELQPGVRTLGQRERTLLLLADGSRSARDFQGLFDGSGEEIALRLLSQGYLERQTGPKAPPAAPAPPRPASEKTAAAAIAKPAFPPSVLPQVQAQPAGADPFEGKRSLATTRMFLFDICERMFARRSPEMAEYFRQALRSAKDRKTMLATSRQMLEHIEVVAGHERADALSERIAMLLPDDAYAEIPG